MVTYAIYRSDDNQVEAVNLTEMVEELMSRNPNYSYVSAVIEVANMIEATHIVSDESHDKIMLMFPNAKIFDYKGGDIN